jgi:outer membrane murein-binding lipoprotein Lpp
MKDDHVGVLLDDINSKFDAVVEVVGSVAGDVQTLKSTVEVLKDDMYEFESDVKAIKAAVIDQTHELTDYEHRIVSLENAA